MQRRYAFSLIELLVVIALIAVLTGIIVPVIRAAKATAQQVVCAANLRNLGVALAAYVHENDGWLCPAEPRDKSDEVSQDNWYMNMGLLGSMNVEPQRDATGNLLGPPAQRTVLTCPSHSDPTMTRDESPLFPPQERPYALSYMMNGTWRLSNRGGLKGSPRRASEFRSPNETLALCDGNGYSTARGIVLYEACPAKNFEYRHRDRTNILMLDGHTCVMKQPDIPMGRESRYTHFWSEKK